MDNRQIDISSDGKGDFDLVMELAVNDHKTVGYRVKDNVLILYWSESNKMTPLPYKMNTEEVTAFAWGWLSNNKPSGGQPDHDGHNEQGFRVFNEDWGHVDSEWQAYIAIEPIWAMYGK